MYCKKYFYLSLLALIGGECLAQPNHTDTRKFKLVIAGKEYQKRHFHQWLWGKNRRKEWTTPVYVPIINLDTAFVSLKPYKAGGGNETKSLRLLTSTGKEYTIRSINKSRDDVVPDIFQNTLVEDIIKDGISMSHPYGAFALPAMEAAAGIYHTKPSLVYVAPQPALDTFNERFGGDLYLLEQRPDGDWSDAANFGNFKYFTSTHDLIEKLPLDNSIKVDQFSYIKARLFDMLIADWDRHEDNWRWGSNDTGHNATYHPVPRDRDQAFYTHNGFLIDRILPSSGLGFMQNFDYTIPDVAMLNFEDRNMDRLLSNEMTKADWMRAARSIQQSLTDSVITVSVQELPPEIYDACGKEFISKLKARRDDLVKYAEEYYRFLADEVEISGSLLREYFDVERVSPVETLIKVFGIDQSGAKAREPFYSRQFTSKETKEIRLFGIGGKDVFSVEGPGNKIKLRLIGGPDYDSITASSGAASVPIYDDRNNFFDVTNAHFHLGDDSAIHVYDYRGNEYDSKGFAPSVFYTNEDRLYVGLGYGFTKHAWRKKPYATKQSINVHYSISQNAFSATYKALYPNLFKSWNGRFLANYDAIRWTNFFGLGNESISTTDDKKYYRIRTREWLASTGIEKVFGKGTVNIAAFFQSVKILNDSDRYIVKEYAPLDMDALENNDYAGAEFTYNYLNVDDSIVPLKGISFTGTANYTANLTHGEFFQKYLGRVQLYFPLLDKFSVAIRSGAATIVGGDHIVNSAEFYEHAVLGGPENLRGFKRERFWGKTAFFNSNELRYITNIRTHLLNGKAGFLLFFDNGRVWMPGEKSNTIHTAYGGGIMLAPFNAFLGTVTYGVSKESQLVQIRLNKLF